MKGEVQWSINSVSAEHVYLVQYQTIILLLKYYNTFFDRKFPTGIII